MPQHPPRRRSAFIELADDLHRHLDLAGPALPDAPDQALTVDIAWRDSTFSLRHDAEREGEAADCIRIQCRFGAIPDEDADRILSQALVANGVLARQQAGMLSLDVADGSLVFSCVQPLVATHAAELAQALSRVAEAANTWRQRNAFATH